jgi:NhaP-type Na+/H+ or K+/H+ antiporter
MKYVPIIAMVVAQQGATIFFMECVRRDLLLAVGFSTLVGIAVGLLVRLIQSRMGTRRTGR